MAISDKIPVYDRRIEVRSTDPVMRFEFDGYVYDAIDWNSLGFKTHAKPDCAPCVGDTFVIRAIGYGSQRMIPVTIRAELRKRDSENLSIRFLQNHERDRRAFENFVARSIKEENRITTV